MSGDLENCRFWNERTGTLWFRLRRQVCSERKEDEVIEWLKSSMVEFSGRLGLRHLHLDLRNNRDVLKICALVSKPQPLETIKIDLRHCDLKSEQMDDLLVGLLSSDQVKWIGLEDNPGAQELERQIKFHSLTSLERVDVIQRMKLSLLLCCSEQSKEKNEDSKEWKIEVNEDTPEMPFYAHRFQMISSPLNGKMSDIRFEYETKETVWHFREIFNHKIIELDFIHPRLITTLDFSGSYNLSSRNPEGWPAFLQEVVGQCPNLECLNFQDHPLTARELIHFYRFFMTHPLGVSMLSQGPLKFIVLIKSRFSSERDVGVIEATIHDTRIKVMSNNEWYRVDQFDHLENLTQKFIYWDEKYTRAITDYVLSRDEYYGDTDVRPLNRTERRHVEYHGITFPSYFNQEMINPSKDQSSDEDTF